MHIEYHKNFLLDIIYTLSSLIFEVQARLKYIHISYHTNNHSRSSNLIFSNNLSCEHCAVFTTKFSLNLINIVDVTLALKVQKLKYQKTPTHT